MPNTQTCHQHPNRTAVESCEVCARPLCGSCLWYAESGERLCAEHGEAWRAEGRTVFEPERYAEGIAFSEVSASRAPPRRESYRGNSSDVMGFVSAIMAGAVMLSCFGFWYLLPLMAFLFGLLSWLQSRDALDPGRTRVFAGLGMASGGLFLMMFFGAVLLCTMCYVLTLTVSSSGGGGSFSPTPFVITPVVSTPFPSVTPTP